MASRSLLLPASLRLSILSLTKWLSWILSPYTGKVHGQTHLDLEKNSEPANGDETAFPKSSATPQSPYVVGSTVTLHLERYNGQPTEARILRVQEEYDSSRDLVVEISHPVLMGTYVARLYDRRFAPEFRSRKRATTWTPDIEAELHDLDATGDVERFFEEWRNMQQVVGGAWLHEEDWLKWSAGKQEAYLQMLRHDFWLNECLSTMTLNNADLGPVWVSSSLHGECSKWRPHLDIPGILTRYAEGVSTVKPA